MSLLWPKPFGAGGDKTRVAQAASDAKEAQMTVRDVEARLERLSLVCEALWTLVRERTGLTEEDIVQRMTDLDLTDGKLDGRRQKSNTCASCGRSVARRRRVCLYCGAVIGKEDAFDGV